MQDIIAGLGIDGLSVQNKLIGGHARKMAKYMSQPFAGAEVFTGMKEYYVQLDDCAKDSGSLWVGQCDNIPEMASFHLTPEASPLEGPLITPSAEPVPPRRGASP